MSSFKFLFLLVLLPFMGKGQSVVVLEQRSINFNLSIDQEIVNWNASFRGFESLSKEEKEIYYWTNYSRKDPRRFWDSVMVPIMVTFPQLRGAYAASLKQDLYATRRLPLLALSDTLNQTSKSHAEDIGFKSASISHTSTNGTRFSERLTQAGIRNCGSENMSLGNGDVLMAIAMLYLDYGLENLGHRKTLLNPEYVHIGVGATHYGTEQLFFVQDFSCEQ
ncbi:MAG TPA: CAP domain-containing protein [Chitinophagaceae bacterium]